MKKCKPAKAVPLGRNDPLLEYYHTEGKRYSVARLIEDTKDLEPFDLPLAGVDLSAEIWRGCGIFDLARHVRKCMDADLTKPIILDWDGGIADGRHRVIKAIVEGKRTIKAVRMTWRPNNDGDIPA